MLGGDRMKLDYVLKFEDFLEGRLHTQVRDELVEMSFDMICCAGLQAGARQVYPSHACGEY
jgi:hypothetical protein